MTRFSNDLRWRIIWQRKVLNFKYEKIARNLNISVGAAYNTCRRFERTGDVAPSFRKGGIKKALHQFEEFLIIHTFLIDPGTYLHEFKRNIEGYTGTDISLPTILRTLRRHGFSRQKLRQVALQRSELDRLQYMAEIEMFDPRMLIFLDETGSDRRSSISLRKFGYGLRGITPEKIQLLVRGKRDQRPGC